MIKLAATPHRRTASGERVLLLHGIGCVPATMAKTAKALERDGFQTLNIGYPSRKRSIGALADYVHDRVTEAGFADDGICHLVTHSMGGLVARAYITRYRPRIGRVVMLGPPSQGSEVADILAGLKLYHRYFGPAAEQLTTNRDPITESLFGIVDFPLGVVAGSRAINLPGWLMIPRPNDGLISVANTHCPGEADHIVIPVAHSFLPRSRIAARNTCHFLRHGRFEAA